SVKPQNYIWQREVKSGRAVADVDSLNARGGHSEHHTGLAVDVIISNYSVEKSDEFEWYKDNCYKYGFIIRYPKGKEIITGYAYEPWHLRYLGEDLAVLVYESGLTYEEYYELKIEPQIFLKDTRSLSHCILNNMPS
ncbi:MAG: M15 family metallopeptidase, partial [Eubacteriales bacterium]|nr:M15 family metallopeptidase [Eubacteriales bacterium]